MMDDRGKYIWSGDDHSITTQNVWGGSGKGFEPMNSVK